MERIKIGKIYNSKNCGKFKVISKGEFKGAKPYYNIKFLQTGYETSTRYDTIKTGQVYDPYYPTVYNIGYIGEAKDNNIDLSMRGRWERLLDRCYNVSSPYYHVYGGAGITVCERWLCYTNFVEDCKQLPGYEDMINNPHIKYHLDKDILQQGIPVNQKVYSPTTCMFVPASENSYQVAIDHYNNHNNEYYNVSNHYNAYNVILQINGIIHRIGRYKDPIIAANAANHARTRYGLPILNINVPYISPEEVNSQNIRKLTEMVKIIN